MHTQLKGKICQQFREINLNKNNLCTKMYFKRFFVCSLGSENRLQSLDRAIEHKLNDFHKLVERKWYIKPSVSVK